MTERGLQRLGQYLRERLSADDLDLLCGNLPAPRPEDYDRAFDRVAARLGALEREAVDHQEEAAGRSVELPDWPAERRTGFLQDSSAALLSALSYNLMRQSFAERFGEVRRSLELADLAVVAARRAAVAPDLSPETGADLLAEAASYQANARRINSDLRGAEVALSEAERWWRRGTRDRYLRAQIVSFRAALSFQRDELDEAIGLMDLEISLWRSLGEEAKAGRALIGRGVSTVWVEPLDRACRYLREGAAVAADEALPLVLLPLAEVLARQGEGRVAAELSRSAEVTARITEADRQFATRLRWIRGLVERALGRLGTAEKILTAVREDLAAENLDFLVGLVSLDLAGVYAAQGRTEELKRLAEEAYSIFVSKGVDRPAQIAFLAFYRAVQAETLSEKLAVEVANFLVRSRGNPRLRFEPSES